MISDERIREVVERSETMRAAAAELGVDQRALRRMVDALAKRERRVLNCRRAAFGPSPSIGARERAAVRRLFRGG